VLCRAGSRSREPAQLVTPALSWQHAAMSAFAQPGLHIRGTPDPRWDSSAACSTSPLGPDAWFCDQGKLREAAIETCLTCPVRQQCAEWAIGDPDLRGGIFGGLSHEARQDERRRRKAEAAALAEEARLAELRQRSARAAQQAAKQVCDHGHDLTIAANVRLVTRPSGAIWRVCRPCKRRTRNASANLRRTASGDQVRAAQRARYAKRQAARAKPAA
jgi:WhiB family redox-sensing transcriptional regulator